MSQWKITPDSIEKIISSPMRGQSIDVVILDKVSQFTYEQWEHLMEWEIDQRGIRKKRHDIVFTGNVADRYTGEGKIVITGVDTGNVIGSKVYTVDMGGSYETHTDDV
jgi:hypothetical protein